MPTSPNRSRNFHVYSTDSFWRLNMKILTENGRHPRSYPFSYSCRTPSEIYIRYSMKQRIYIQQAPFPPLPRGFIRVIHGDVIISENRENMFSGWQSAFADSQRFFLISVWNMTLVKRGIREWLSDSFFSYLPICKLETRMGVWWNHGSRQQRFEGFSLENPTMMNEKDICYSFTRKLQYKSD